MAIAHIQEWLNGDQSFDQGVELLGNHAPDHPKLIVFRKFGDSKIHRRWLHDALSEINDQSAGDQSQGSKPGKTERKPRERNEPEQGTRWFDPKKLSPTLQDEYQNRIRSLFALRAATHRDFDPSKPQEHNAQVSQKLKQISHQLDVFFERAKRYIETGKEDHFGLFARYKTLERAIQCHREYISRRRKKKDMKAAVEDRQKQLETDLDAYQALEDRLYELT